MNILQINGRRVYGPPKFWVGDPPPTSCELFISGIPRTLKENALLEQFQRFGIVYEFRLMMDFNEQNRGFGFVKYTNQNDAIKAKEIMSHFYIKRGNLLKLRFSYDKCRLFVGNIPKNLTYDDVYAVLKMYFTNMKDVVLLNDFSVSGDMNRGFAFMDFQNHRDALMVKQNVATGKIYIKEWGCDLKVVWAKPQKFVDPEYIQNTTSIFVRNIHYSINVLELQNILLNCVDLHSIRRITRVREFAFIEFHDRYSAECAFAWLRALTVAGYKLYVEWTIAPSYYNKVDSQNFYVQFNLRCLANHWIYPTIIFGRIDGDLEMQYVTVLLRKGISSYRAIFIELNLRNISNAYNRVCEIVLALITKEGGLPSLNYVIKCIDNTAHIVAAVLRNMHDFKKATCSEELYKMDWSEIKDMLTACEICLRFPVERFVEMYFEGLFKKQQLYIEPILSLYGTNRSLACIEPRQICEPYKYECENPIIFLAQCYKNTNSNYIIDKVTYLRDISFLGSRVLEDPIPGFSLSLTNTNMDGME